MIPQGQTIGVRDSRSRARLFQHPHDLAFGEAFRQNLPARRALHIHGRIMRDLFVHQQPAIEPAQRTQLPRNGPRIDAMTAQSFHKVADIFLSSRSQQAIATFYLLGKLFQIAPIGITGRRPHPLFHPQIHDVLADDLDVSGQEEGAGIDRLSPHPTPKTAPPLSAYLPWYEPFVALPSRIVCIPGLRSSLTFQLPKSHS